jgi:hypothetical protein
MISTGIKPVMDLILEFEQKTVNLEHEMDPAKRDMLVHKQDARIINRERCLLAKKKELKELKKVA